MGAADPTILPSRDIIIRAELAGIDPEAIGTICFVDAQPVKSAIKLNVAQTRIALRPLISLPLFANNVYKICLKQLIFLNKVKVNMNDY